MSAAAKLNYRQALSRQLAKVLLSVCFTSVCFAVPIGLNVLLPQHAHAEDRVLLLEDFEDGKLSQRWTALGKIAVERIDNSNEPDDSQGMVARCEAKRNSKFIVNQDFQRPPYEEFDTIRFRIQASDANEDRPLAFEFQAFSVDRRAALWRKFTVDSNQWKTIELPMQHFRYTKGATLDWFEVSRFGVHFRDTCEVALDDFELVATDQQANPYFTPHEVAHFAFGEKALVTESDHFAVITDDERVNRKRTLEECEKLFEYVRKDFPDLPAQKRRVPVLIFAQQRDFRQFWSKLGGLYVSQVPPVRSNGYSLLGIAGTYYSDKFGPVRPVLIHEACHAMLAPLLGVSNSSEWLHEGLANYYQLNWTNQDIHALNRPRFAEGRQLPLVELLSGERVNIRDYAQVTLFVAWLLDDDERRGKLVQAMKAMRNQNSTKLEPLCEQFFGKSLSEMESEWARWAKAK